MSEENVPEGAEVENTKLQVKELFDRLDFKIPADQNNDKLVDLGNLLGKIHNDIISKAQGVTDFQKELPDEISAELAQYFSDLEVASKQIWSDDKDREKNGIKVEVSEAEVYYEIGRVDIALEILTDEKDGALKRAKELSDESLVGDITSLVNLLSALEESRN